jgi:hypothetical protein
VKIWHPATKMAIFTEREVVYRHADVGKIPRLVGLIVFELWKISIRRNWKGTRPFSLNMHVNLPLISLSGKVTWISNQFHLDVMLIGFKMIVIYFPPVRWQFGGAREGSKSNIPCCGFAGIWRAHPAWIWRMSRKCCAQIRVRCASCSPRPSCKCCAHLPREERATRDVTFGPPLYRPLFWKHVK